MQIKTTVRYHLTLVKMAIIKKSTNKKCWKECREKGTLLQCWWNVSWCSHFGKQDNSFSGKKLKPELLHDLAVPLVGTDPEKTIT